MQVTQSGRVDLSLCREGVSERGGSILWDAYAISKVSIMVGSPCGRMGSTMGYGLIQNLQQLNAPDNE